MHNTECTSITQPLPPKDRSTARNSSLRRHTEAIPNRRSKYHKYLQISEDPEAYSHAHSLLYKMDREKKELQQRRHREHRLQTERMERLRRETEVLEEAQSI